MTIIREAHREVVKLDKKETIKGISHTQRIFYYDKFQLGVRDGVHTSMPFLLRYPSQEESMSGIGFGIYLCRLR